jgi:hypothetical protein
VNYDEQLRCNSGATDADSNLVAEGKEGGGGGGAGSVERAVQRREADAA